MAVQASLCLAWSETPKDSFSRDEAQIFLKTQIWTLCGFNLAFLDKLKPVTVKADQTVQISRLSVTLPSQME